MEIKGTVILNNGIERGTSKSGKTWEKASVVIQTEGQYPKKILLSNFKNAAEFAKLAVSTVATFHIEVESREWTNQNTGKTSWFTEVSCWKWEVMTSAVPQTNYQPHQPMEETQDDSDPLPF